MYKVVGTGRDLSLQNDALHCRSAHPIKLCRVDKQSASTVDAGCVLLIRPTLSSLF